MAASSVRRFVKSLSGRSPAGRGVTVLADDAFVISYPRSGNTWLRFLLGNLRAADGSPTTFRNIEQRVPDIHQNTDRALLALPRPRLLKSHEPYDPRYGKVLYLVRNPLDVTLSYFYYLVKIRKIDDDYPMEQFVERFLEGELDGFGTWDAHVGGWLAARRDDADFLFARYEDLRAAPEAALVRMARFLGIDASPHRLAEAVRLASADRMRELEKEQGREWRPLRKAREDIPFVRADDIEGRDDATRLSTDLGERIRERWRPTMAELGYAPPDRAESGAGGGQPAGG